MVSVVLHVMRVFHEGERTRCWAQDLTRRNTPTSSQRSPLSLLFESLQRQYTIYNGNQHGKVGSTITSMNQNCHSRGEQPQHHHRITLVTMAYAIANPKNLDEPRGLVRLKTVPSMSQYDGERLARTPVTRPTTAM